MVIANIDCRNMYGRNRDAGDTDRNKGYRLPKQAYDDCTNYKTQVYELNLKQELWDEVMAGTSITA